MSFMSYTITTQQFIDNLKDLTRRLGWGNLKAGDKYTAVEKVRGLKRGDHVKVLGECMCISNTKEPLDEIIRRPYRDGNTRSEMEREGFPQMTAEQFVTFFCDHMKVTPDTTVNRIAFKKVSSTIPKRTNLKQLTLGD